MKDTGTISVTFASPLSDLPPSYQVFRIESSEFGFIWSGIRVADQSRESPLLSSTNGITLCLRRKHDFMLLSSSQNVYLFQATERWTGTKKATRLTPALFCSIHSALSLVPRSKGKGKDVQGNGRRGNGARPLSFHTVSRAFWLLRRTCALLGPY